MLPVPYFPVVFSLPAEIGDIAYQNKAIVYDLLMKVSADVMLTIAADPEHLGCRIAITSVLHTWGSALMHHPHVHMIVPGGGLSPDGSKWIRGSAKFLLPVRVLSALKERYADFGPTFAAEKLLKHEGIAVSAETVRQLQIQLGQWRPKSRRGKRVLQARERGSRFGELVQVDGSVHDWLEGGGPESLVAAASRLFDGLPRRPDTRPRSPRYRQAEPTALPAEPSVQESPQHAPASTCRHQPAGSRQAGPAPSRSLPLCPPSTRPPRSQKGDISTLQEGDI